MRDEDAGIDNMGMVYGRRTNRPGAGSRRSRGPYDGRYFRDDEHRDVLLLIDNIFALFKRAWKSPAFLAKCHPDSRYQSTMGTIYRASRSASPIPCRRPSPRSGVIVRQTILPTCSVSCVFAFSASIVLSRQTGDEGLYPAIDLLQSSSKMATRHRWRPALHLAQEIRRTLAQYESLKELWPCWEWSTFPRRSKRRCKGTRLERFLTQPSSLRNIQRNEGQLVTLKTLWMAANAFSRRVSRLSRAHSI